MDADIFAVYQRLAERHDKYFYYSQGFRDTFRKLFPPDLCTAEMTTFLKETNTNGN